MVLDEKLAPQVIARAAVPVIAIHRVWAWVGVPDKLVVIDVMASVCAVIEKKSTLSVFIVGMAAEATVPVLLVILLLVKVLVEEILGITKPSTDKTPAEPERVVAVALPSSIFPTT